jgi:hypothetical protein
MNDRTLPRLYPSTTPPRFPFLKRLPIHPRDFPFIIICLGASIYLTLKDPVFITTLASFSIPLLSLWHIAKGSGFPLRFWHIALTILTATLTFSLFETPAHAIFLSGLEEFFKELAQGVQSGGSGATITDDVIELIFNLIRGVFLLIVAGASLFAYNQAQQGNDWRPIVSQVGLAFAIVIAVDIITFLFVGTGT